MLDNFGMGEFLTLALFALLFFGPERLPQIGAQLGRWLSKLTSYSKAFMNQWTEEAAAVQGAVQDVMSIRDEIRAAQAEIAETLSAAQQDINDTISEARGTIQAAKPTAEGFLKAGGAPALADADDANRFQAPGSASTSRDDGEAVARTQDIVNALLIQQGVASQEDAEVPKDEDAEAAESPAETEAVAADTLDEEEAYQRNLAAIQEIMGRSSKTKPAPTEESQPTLEKQKGEGAVAQEDTATPGEEAELPAQVEQAVVTQPGLVLSGSLGTDQMAQTEPVSKREKTESAFDKTQRILNQLMGIEPEPEPEPEPALEPEPAVLSESPSTSDLSGASGDVVDEPDLTQEPGPAVAPRSVDAVHQVRGLTAGVSQSEFTKLSIEVSLLKRELRTLREELQALHVKEPVQALVASRLDEASRPGSDLQEGDGSTDVPVEEIA